MGGARTGEGRLCHAVTSSSVEPYQRGRPGTGTRTYLQVARTEAEEAGIDTIVITVVTGRRVGVHDLTSEVRAYLRGRGDGLLNVFVPHATAGLAIIETGAGSDHDLLDRLEHLLPHDDPLYRHRHGAPGHGADHVIPAFSPRP